MTEPLVIFGAGGHGREILQILLDINAQSPNWNILGFLADAHYQCSEVVHGLPMLGGVEWLKSRPDVRVVIAVGAPAARRRVHKAIVAAGPRLFPVIIHPRSCVGHSVGLGAGSVIFPGAIITADVQLGEQSHVNVGASISHDDKIGDYATIGPGSRLCGYVQLGTGVEVGAGAVIIPRITVNDWTVVGAAAAVIRDHPSNVTLAGCPARVINTRQAGWHEVS